VGTYKIKLLALLSQLVALQAKKYTFLHYKIIGAPKNLNTSRDLYLGLDLTILDYKNHIHYVSESL
jgi:hypothetical protein